jgi:UDP-N-acetylmuramyl pentapeptide phosphotransferase/UDP-N-acetylglucosamine-1-phosphate transferase
MIIVLSVVTAATISALSIWLMLRTGRAGPMDQPNHRSLHDAPVPRSGGVGILAGASTALFIVDVPVFIAVGVAILAAVSWLDDRTSLPVLLRFGTHFLVSGLFVSLETTWGAAGWVVVILVTLGMVWSINLFNFMDGANGLAGGMAAIGFSAYAWIAHVAGDLQLSVVSAAIAAAAVGFLIFNFDPAKIFMGDVGSISVGFLASAVGIVGIDRGLWPIWFPLLVFSVFLVDATTTLLRRALRRERVWEAHRDHAYQRLVRSGWTHRRLAWTAYCVMLITALSAGLLVSAAAIQWAAVLFWAVAYLLILRWVERKAPMKFR